MASEIKQVFIPRTQWLGPVGNERTVDLPDGCTGVLFTFSSRGKAAQFHLSSEPMLVFDVLPHARQGEHRDLQGNITKKAETVDG